MEGHELLAVILSVCEEIYFPVCSILGEAYLSNCPLVRFLEATEMMADPALHLGSSL